MTVAIDFDGTIVTHEYPKVGQPIYNCIKVLKRLNDAGINIILYTMRHGDTLREALNYLETNEIKLWGVNENPEQSNWSESRKVYANIYIDDAALGVPLVIDKEISSRPYVDWVAVEDYLFPTDPS